MARVVIVARPEELFEFVAHALAQEGYRVRIQHDWRGSLAQINRVRPHIVILDASDSISMAEELCARIRNRQPAGSRILIVRPAGAENREGSLSGADLYLERPLHPRALLRRVRELLVHPRVERAKNRIVVGELVIDPASFRVTRAGQLLSLTLVEFRLLNYFAANPNVVCRRSDLLELVWNNPRVTPRTVDVCVRHLRQKIEEDPQNPRLIRSVWAQGYIFEFPQGQSAESIPVDATAIATTKLDSVQPVSR